MSRAALTSIAEVKSAFSWDESSFRYRGPGGTYVSERAVKQAINTVSDVARTEMSELAGRVARGEINVSDFQQQMMANLKNLHLAQGVAGRGGFEQMTQADYGKVGSVLKFQYERLDSFSRDLAEGRYDGAEDAVIARAEMYGKSGNQTYENARRFAAADQGFTEERRVLGHAEHCPDCVNAAELGWQPAGELPEIGDSVCNINCLCTFEYRKLDPNDGEIIEG